MNEMNEEVNARMILAAIEILHVTGIWLARWGPWKTNGRLGLFCRNCRIEDVDIREEEEKKKAPNNTQGRVVLFRRAP